MTGAGLSLIPGAAGAGEFLARFGELYFDSFLTNVTIGVLLGALGLFVVLRRVVFVSAALSQVASAGLALAFLFGALAAHQGPPDPAPDPAQRARAGERLDDSRPKTKVDQEILEFLQEDAPQAKKRPVMAAPAGGMATMAPRRQPAKPVDTKHFSHQHEPINPLLFSLLLTVIVALLLSMLVTGRRWRSTHESIVGMVFILAGAASIVLANLAEKGAHEIANLLFGMVVFIPKGQQLLIYISALVGLALYVIAFKDFVFASFDPTAARASGFPVRLTNGLLFVVIAVSIAVCTRAVGAMPVFALTVLPGAAALQIHDRMVPAAITAAALGGLSAGGGYFLSGLLNLSAGPMIVLVGTVSVVVAWSGRRGAEWLASRRAAG